MRLSVISVLFFFVPIAIAQQTGPALSVDATAGHPISPDIYGINFFWDLGAAGDPNLLAYSAAANGLRPTVRRWGGNNMSTYNWKLDVMDLDADWFYEVLPASGIDASKLPDGSSFNAYVDQARAGGGKVIGTVPILGWLPKLRGEACSYDVAKYGKQCKQDPYAQYHAHTCGNGIVYTAACGDPAVQDGKAPSNPTYIKGDPNDVYAPYDESFQGDWIRYLISRYGKASQGGVAIWALDNEPIWWDINHTDVHSDPYTYDEIFNIDMRYAAAIKQADPGAMVAGPVGDNWSSLFFSKKDIVSGWAKGNYWSNPVDRNAHGGVPFLSWYLQQMKNYEQQHGVRILDYLDQHAYLAPGNVSLNSAGDASTQAQRLDYTRVFWDPTFIVTGDYWIKDVDNSGAPIAPAFIPRLKQIVAQNYPGTKIALTEYNFGGLESINGALAQADLLGIFGREGLDAAALWGPPKPTDPGAFAFKIFRNYDDIGGAFGETAVQATSADQGQLSVYAALRSDLNLTILAINKTGNDLSSSLSLANFAAGSAAKVWRYSSANLNAIVAQPDAAVTAAGLTSVFPANSITLFVIPPKSLPVAKPTISAVTNAASYGTAIAPGQMVVVWGDGMGQREILGLETDSNGMVNTSIAGVRVLFDGIPSPLVYTSVKQIAAVVPYLGAVKATTHVQVEYQGVRSDPLMVPVSQTAPGLFTLNSSGQGPGAILNSDYSINTPNAPAAAGSVVILYGTGEGITDPPGVDGRPAIDVLPHPLATVTVDIGGLPAKVLYAGAAYGDMPGVFQINAQMSPSVQPGNNVPVHVKIGANTSPDGVTLAVR